MMPPPLHVCNGLASPADAACRMCCEICEVIRFRGSTGFTSIRVFCRILLPCRWNNFAENVVSSSVACSDYLPQSSTKSVQYSCEAKKCRCWYRTSGHSENIVVYAAHSLAKA